MLKVIMWSSAVIVFLAIATVSVCRRRNISVETFVNSHGEAIRITFLRHASISIEYAGKRIYVDPVDCAKWGDGAFQASADYIFITHGHSDHHDQETINRISRATTVVVGNEMSMKKIGGRVNVLRNGDSYRIAEAISVDAVPAYNITPGRLHYHPRGNGNGYVFNLNGFRIYVSGDTEYVEEMTKLQNVDVAVLAVNQPYTMTCEQFVQAVKVIKPRMVYPYHLGDTDLFHLRKLLAQLSTPLKIIREMR